MQNVIINGISMSAISDTGAELNILPEHSIPDLDLVNATVSISMWWNFEFTVFGCTNCSVTYNGVTANDVFYVIWSASHCKPLLTYALSCKLGIDRELASVTVNWSWLNSILVQHDEFFKQGGGHSKYWLCLWSVPPENAMPISIPACRVPPKVLPLLKEEIGRTYQNGTICKINEPTLRWSPKFKQFCEAFTHAISHIWGN